MRWNMNGYTVTVRINLFAVGDDGGDLSTAIPAALTLISPALSLTHWQALFADPQLPQALMATLVSTTIAAVGALLIALLVIVALCGLGRNGSVCAPFCRGCSPFPMWLLPPAPFCSLLTEGCFMTISHISLRQWTNWVLGWASRWR